MLYKAIRTLALSTCALLITRTFGAEYYVTASSMNTTDQNICIDANADDTCTFLCDKERWGIDFDCHNAGTCKVYCGNEKECFKESAIDARNSNNNGLYIYATGAGNDCLKKSNIYLPNHGNAIFNASDTSGNNRFKEMTIHSGINTQNIYIDCSGGDEKDECKQLIVNAQSAKYFEIYIGSGELNGDENKNNPAIINCPVNSTYSGLSCIIDASDNGKLEFIQVNSVYGIDQDLLIKIGDLSIIDNVDVSCSSGSTFVKNQTIQFDNACGNILPTLNPTVSTSHPTASPTSNPITTSPTMNPTTTSPTTNPITISPTMNPSNPTVPPTTNPITTSPTTNPITIPPTMNPSNVAPTPNPTVSPNTQTTTEYPTLSPTNAIILSTNPNVVPTNMPTSSTRTTTEYPTLSPTNAIILSTNMPTSRSETSTMTPSVMNLPTESDSNAEHYVTDEISTSNVMQDVINGKSNNGSNSMKVFTENNYLVLILSSALLIVMILLIISVMGIFSYKRKQKVVQSRELERLSSTSVINTPKTRSGVELAEKSNLNASNKFGEEKNAIHNLNLITTQTKGGPDDFVNDTMNTEGDNKTDDEELYLPSQPDIATIGGANAITKGNDEDKSDDEIYKEPANHEDGQYKD